MRAGTRLERGSAERAASRAIEAFEGGCTGRGFSYTRRPRPGAGPEKPYLRGHAVGAPARWTSVFEEKFEFQTWRRAAPVGRRRVWVSPAHPREREAPERHHCGPATISHEYTLMEHEARFPPLRSTLIAIAAALNNVAFGYDGICGRNTVELFLSLCSRSPVRIVTQLASYPALSRTWRVRCIFPPSSKKWPRAA
jgi:hypothetical protein